MLLANAGSSGFKRDQSTSLLIVCTLTEADEIHFIKLVESCTQYLFSRLVLSGGKMSANGLFKIRGRIDCRSRSVPRHRSNCQNDSAHHELRSCLMIDKSLLTRGLAARGVVSRQVAKNAAYQSVQKSMPLFNSQPKASSVSNQSK